MNLTSNEHFRTFPAIVYTENAYSYAFTYKTSRCTIFTPHARNRIVAFASIHSLYLYPIFYSKFTFRDQSLPDGFDKFRPGGPWILHSRINWVGIHFFNRIGFQQAGNIR